MFLMRLGRLLYFLFHNFATPLIFFITFHQLGAKAAILFAVAVSAIQVLFHRLRGIRLSPFFIVSSAFTVLFGGMDLLIREPRFLRFEPFVQNALGGVALLATTFTRRPVLEWLAEGLPRAVRPSLEPGMRGYLRKLSLVWASYFFIKGGAFLYLAFRVNLGKLVLYRSIIGTASALLLVGGEIVYRKYFLLSRDRRQLDHPG